MVSGRTVVDGRFELIEPLGSGGMGTVWRALDVMLHRDVALKEVRPDISPGASSPAVQRERVLREARALARIGHPNVVALHHIVNSEAEDHPWIVMELVRGQSLADRLAAGPLPVGVAARLGRGILAGLRAAHSVGVLHRDIKPANVMLREDGSPVVTDFGIAAIEGLGGLTSTGNLVGSLEYVAPERLGGKEGHPASDLWSLGLVLYVAVEGYHPMRRETTVAILAAVLAGDVPPPRRAGALTPVLEALLVPEPERRPSAEQVDQLLAQAISATSVPSMPLAAPQRFPGPEPTTRTSVTPAGEYRPFAHTPPPGGQYRSQPYAVPAELSHARPHSAPSGYQVAAYSPTPVDPHRLPQPPHPARRILLAAGLVVALVTVGAAVTLWQRPDTTASPPPETTQSIQPSIPGQTTTVRTSPAAVPRTGADLFDPATLRTAVTALEKAAGTTEFTETKIYADHVSTGAPVADRPSVYDLYDYYRDSQKAKRTGPGGQLSDPTIQLATINWDVLPALFEAAAAKLNIPKPTMRYVIVNPAWTFNDDKPTLLVYLVDDYAGAYLAADLDGAIIRTYAAER
ncbi:protein kinase [Nocardia sp. NPDC050712]|uniref:serine/threonine-protein kinase n=1 Tax=Nocardia sp. NPDC050712 TaxID=3155518 RepID=UPI0033C9A359